jgi:hypothetical protein
MGQIQNVVIILIITVLLSIVTLGLAYIFDLYLNPFIIIEISTSPFLKEEWILV